MHPAAPGEWSRGPAGTRGGWAGPLRGRGRETHRPGPPPPAQNGTARPGLKPLGGGASSGGGGSDSGEMGLRAGGALGRAGMGRGSPEGPGPSGSAQGGSIHSGCIAAVHNVPLSVLIRPLPSVLDPAKVQSLVDTIRVRPWGKLAAGRASEEGGCAGRQTGLVQSPPQLSICCVTLSKLLGLSGPLFPL